MKAFWGALVDQFRGTLFRPFLRANFWGHLSHVFQPAVTVVLNSSILIPMGVDKDL